MDEGNTVDVGYLDCAKASLISFFRLGLVNQVGPTVAPQLVLLSFFHAAVCSQNYPSNLEIPYKNLYKHLERG